VVILAALVALAVLAAIVAAIPRRDVTRSHQLMQTLTPQHEKAGQNER
jgi:hypothetical protein